MAENTRLAKLPTDKETGLRIVSIVAKGDGVEVTLAGKATD